MFEIITKLQISPVVKRVQIIDMLDESTAKYLKCMAEITDGSKLYVTESLAAGRNKYSYH